MNEFTPKSLFFAKLGVTLKKSILIISTITAVNFFKKP